MRERSCDVGRLYLTLYAPALRVWLSGARPSCSCAHDVPEPFDACGVDRIEQHRVETARRGAAEPREIESCGSGHSRALPRCDACCGAAEIAARAQAHLDEHKRVAVPRDEVE